MREKKVFIVEDNEDIRDIIYWTLEGSPYAVHLFGTVGEFNKSLALDRPDLIVLDIRLPDGDGIELCKKVKTDPETGHIPVILMSANSYENEADALENEFISKPFNIEIFKLKLESFL